ncbi:MAG: hypothetical protein ACYDA4_05660 [Ignavibacteriaceae bacterium]
MITVKLSSRSDFSQVYKLIHGDIDAGKEIVYDLRNYSFFEPVDILLFAMSLMYFKNNNFKQKYIPPLKSKVDAYLSAIGLFEFCKTNYEEPKTIEIIPSLSAMPLRRITPVTMDNYILLAQSYFSQHCTTKDISFLNITISELINNVQDHSQSPIDAYIFCQLYPRQNIIKVVVGDLGIGIPVSVNNFLKSQNKSVFTDKDAISWAVGQNTSTKSQPHNRGKGLNNLVEFIQFNGSIMHIYSNSGLLIAAKDGTDLRENNIRNFGGTIIQMDINIDNLPANDNIVDDFWEQSQF